MTTLVLNVSIGASDTVTATIGTGGAPFIVATGKSRKDAVQAALLALDQACATLHKQCGSMDM